MCEDQRCIDVVHFILFFSETSHPDPDSLLCLRRSRGPAAPVAASKPQGVIHQVAQVQQVRQVQATGARAPPPPRLSWGVATSGRVAGRGGQIAVG